MRIRVDPERCQGHSRCVSIAPDLFEVDDYGLSSVVGDGSVPEGRQDAAHLAIANCPEYAIEELPDAP
jgi:ferredoxin